MKRLFVLILTAVPLFGQAQISSGDLKGTVTDPAAAAIVGAKVTIADAERGVSRSTDTDGSGEFRFAIVPPGAYRVRVEAPGFSTVLVDNVDVRVGDTVVLNVALEVGAVTNEITVSAAAAIVEAERTQQAATIDTRGIENLPINRRNYLDLALLTPGVVETNDIVDGSDFRVVQTPQSGLSFGGGNGRGNAFTVDGISNYFNSGGVRPSVSQEAVREFQINRNSFTAEFGGGFGGAINIVTKSGTNELHGNLFGFLRHRSIQARNYFDSEKSPFTRAQYGATFSAPLRRDRTFLFASFERLDRHETAFVPILQDRSAFGRLTASQQQLADFFDNAPLPQLRAYGPAMRQYLITNNFPQTLRLFNQNSGNFPFGEDNTQVSIRLDRYFSEKDHLFLRGNMTQGNNQNAQFGALIGFNRSRGIEQTDGTIMLANSYIFSSQWVAETRAAFGYNKLTVTPIDRFGPDITITGYGSFGREIFLPSASLERDPQFQQVVNFLSAKHTVKFGVDFGPVRDTVHSETFFGGRFLFGENVPLGALLPIIARDPNATNSLITALNTLGQQKLISNLSQPITSLQAYNLGLPILYQQGFGNPDWVQWFQRVAGFVQDAWKPHPRLVLNLGLRYEAEIPADPVPSQPRNIAPRFGFAWTPSSSSNTVIRGGFGLYYGQINAQIANLPATLNGVQIAQAVITPLGIPGLLNPLTGQPLTSFDVYQGLLAKGVIGTRTITMQDIAQFGLKPGPNAPGRVIFDIVKDYVSPYAEQSSFEIEHGFGNMAVSAGFEFNRGLHLPRILDRNLYYAGRTAANQPKFGFYNPAILQYNVEESTANSFYHALTLQFTRRFSRGFSANAHYTFSRAVDEVTDFNTDFAPHDQLNARAERARSSFDQRHRLVASSMIDVKNWVLSPIFIVSSGRPFNVLTGFDNLGDNHPTTHRPFGLGRNVGTGPNYFTADMRLTRRFPLSADGTRNVEFTAEGFNLLNRTNFRTINNTVGNMTLQTLPNPIQGVRGAPTDPLSFTSAYDPRQFQFGLKVNF